LSLSSQELSLVELGNCQDVSFCLIETSRRLSHLKVVEQCPWLIKLFVSQLDEIGNFAGTCFQLGGWCGTSNMRHEGTVICCMPVYKPRHLMY